MVVYLFCFRLCTRDCDAYGYMVYCLHSQMQVWEKLKVRIMSTLSLGVYIFSHSAQVFVSSLKFSLLVCPPILFLNWNVAGQTGTFTSHISSSNDLEENHLSSAWNHKNRIQISCVVSKPAILRAWRIFGAKKDRNIPIASLRKQPSFFTSVTSRIPMQPCTYKNDSTQEGNRKCSWF